MISDLIIPSASGAGARHLIPCLNWEQTVKFPHGVSSRVFLIFPIGDIYVVVCDN